MSDLSFDVCHFICSSFIAGGDECHTTCWAANPAIKEWATKHNLTISSGTESVGGEGTAFGWWIDQVVALLHGAGKRPVMWAPLAWDPWSPPAQLVASNALLNMWTGQVQELTYNMTMTGRNQIVMSVNWYLPANGYSHDPIATLCNSSAESPFRCSAQQQAAIVGGEACMWGEGTDRTNLFSTIWPDLTGVAERLWSPRQGTFNLLDGRMRRLRLQRCRLLSRGVLLSPMSAIYLPDASHTSFHTWREYQTCGAADSGGTAQVLLNARAKARAYGEAVASEARQHRPLAPFD